MKKVTTVLIQIIALICLGGCSEIDTEYGSVNELGNYISFEKTRAAKSFNLLDNVEMYISGYEGGAHLNISDDNIISYEKGELLSVVATINNQSDSDIDLTNFLRCNEGTVFRVDDEYYPASNFAIKDGKDSNGIIKPNEEKIIYIYTEVPIGKIQDDSLIEVYLTYGKDSEPSCAIKEEDLNTNATKNGFHIQLQWSVLADEMW